MRRKFFVSLLCSLQVVLAGCEKRATTQPASSPAATPTPPVASASREWGPADFDVCGLIRAEEFEAIHGSSIKESQSAGASDGDLRISQCYFRPATSIGPVILSVTKGDPSRPDKSTPRELWKKMFGRYGSGETAAEPSEEESRADKRSREKKEKATPPRKIEDAGEEAYWSAGALYVLKDDIFIRVAVGGRDDEETKLKKSKAFAEKALSKL